MVTNKDKIHELDKLFQKIGKEISHQLETMLPDDITPTQFFLIKMIANNKDCKAANIAQCIHISPAAASNMVERLYKNKWIEKIRSEEDRRIVWLKLTEKGKRLLKEIEEKRTEMQFKRFQNVTDEELDLFISIINKILNAKV